MGCISKFSHLRDAIGGTGHGWSGNLTQQTLHLFKRILNFMAETTLKAT